MHIHGKIMGTSKINTERFIKDVYNRPIIWNRHCASNKGLTEKSWVELSMKHQQPISILKAKWKGLRDMFRVEIKRIARNESGHLLIEPHNYDSKWAHYRELLFLADHMRSRSTNLGLLDPVQKMEVLQPYYTMNDDNFELSNADEDSGLTSPKKIKLEPSEPTSLDDMSSTKDSLLMSHHELFSDEGSSFVTNHLIDSQRKRARSKSPTEFRSATADSDDGDRVVVNDDYHFLMSLQPYMSELNLSQKLRVRTKIHKLLFRELYGSEEDA